MGCLYKITSPSQKSYIGITLKTVEGRWAKHKEHALGKRDNGALYSALRKYGPDSFTLEVLVASDDWDSLCRMEREFIQKFQTLSPNGYNIALGGEGVQGKRSEADKRKISEAQKKRFARPDQRAMLLQWGMKSAAAAKAMGAIRREENRKQRLAYLHSPEFKALHSAAVKAAMNTPDVKAKLIACAKTRAADPEWRLKISKSKKGKTHRGTIEWNAHISEARKREWQDPVLRDKRLAALVKARAAKQHT